MTSAKDTAGAGLALVLANVRYWTTVAPIVRAQLTRWEQAAQAIPDPALRALALGKLRDERFNAQVAATLATLAPRSRRSDVVEAIVALQILYDYLDVVSEQSMADPVRDGLGLFAALIDAVSVPADDTRKSFELPPQDDGGYLERLSRTVCLAFARLPGAATVAEVARGAAERCGEAQILHHGASRSGIAELRDWATPRAAGTALGWQELLAGSTASVLAMDALIAAAADPGISHADAEAIDALYLSIGALSMLDSLVDREEDIATGQLSYVELYDNPEAMANGLAKVARDGVRSARGLGNGAHHIVILVGIVAYYASAPSACSDFARPLIAPVRRELAPLITPTLTLMRAWRLAKRMRQWRARDSGENSHSIKGAPA
jgi:tetraprenyl-beta-curcumene synthase